MGTIYSDFVSFVKSFALTYLVWITLHYACSHLYVAYCVPKGIIGFLYSPFMTPMPHCVAMRWVVYNGGKIIEVMWVMVGKWCVEKLIFPDRMHDRHYQQEQQQQQEEVVVPEKTTMKMEALVTTGTSEEVPEEVPEKTF